MIESLQFDRLEAALTTRAGWAALAIVVVAFTLGWLADRKLAARRDDASLAGLRRGVVRLAMPLAALVLLLVARPIARPYLPTLFIDVGVLLALALAAIRIVVYTLRRLVPNATWLESSERTVAFVVWALVALHALGITPQIAAELDGIRLPVGKTEVTLLSIATGTIAVVLTISLTLWLSGLVEQRLLKTHLDASQRALASKLVRALLLVAGVLIAFQSIGFDLTLLSVFGGALGVGIGLGLQKLASNYIAGFVILLDRSIRLGDLVTVDNRHGTVTEVTSRYVVVRAADGVEAIVPNETLVTTTVLNHSLSSRDLRVAVPITIAYDADLERALSIMLDVARAHPRVNMQQERTPTASVVRFSDIGIDLELAVWTEIGQGTLRSDLSRALWKAFREAGIDVPRRDPRIAQEGIGVATASVPASRP